MILRDSTIEIPLPIRLEISRANFARTILCNRPPTPGILRRNLSVIYNHHSVLRQFCHKSTTKTGITKNKYQYPTTKLLVPMSICVDVGSPPKSEKRDTSGGTTFHIITNMTTTMTNMINAGYTRAPMSFLFRDPIFSICDAISRSVTLSFPVFSHDSTIATSESEKLFGNSFSVVERFFPEWIFSIILASIFFTNGFFCSSCSIFTDWRTVSPALTMVARSR